MSFANPPAPPYLAVIFASQRTPGDDAYGATADRMVELASQQPGFLGVESARGADGFGITVSYWENEAAVAAWKAVAEHQLAQKAGKDRWYQRFELKVATVFRAYGFARPETR